MSANAPRSIDEYLKQLRQALEGQDPALIQDALYDAEEYLRAEVAAHPDKSESDVLELIASTYGAPDEVAAAYRDTEAKVKAALKTPAPRSAAHGSGLARFFGVYQDPRAYTSLFYMLLTLSAGFAVLIIGVPFFLAFIGIARVIALGEGRLLEAMTGERMPRRPLHPGPPASWWQRIGEMLTDVRTWTTLLYLLIMLPLGIIYFTVTLTALAIGLRLALAPLVVLSRDLGFFAPGVSLAVNQIDGRHAASPHTFVGSLFYMVFGIVIVTALMHAARAVARGHARF